MSAATPASAAPASSMSTARRSNPCTLLALQAEGRSVLTIEGVATGDTLHPMQEAFRNNHALQCGFCTPGMVMSALDLVKNNPDPDRTRDPRISRRQSLPLHRLSQHRAGDRRGRGGDARRGAAGQRPRGGGGVRPMTTVGTPVRRREDYRFLTGQGTYTDDIDRPHQLYAYILRSPHAHARIAGYRHRGGGAALPGSPRSIPARTWRPTASAGCPAAGRSIRRTARRWPSRRIRCWRWSACAMSATRSRSSSPTPSNRRARPPS